MERLPDLLIKPEPWSGLLMGNHALVRAMFEAGVRVATTYPGSPTPEIAEAIRAIPEDKRPLVFQFATNEKVALEVAFGAAVNGHTSCVFFKSVGLNVASDSAIQLPMMHLPGGMVVVLGDDPGANSSQNEQDNRHFARQSYMPLFEPASPAETYAHFKVAADLARRLNMAVLFRMTTHVCHARQNLSVGALETTSYDWAPGFDPANGPYVPIAADVFPLKRRALDNLEKVEAFAETTSLNAVQSPNGSEPILGKRYGLIATSLPALALLENLHESGRPVDLLKLGLSFPLPKNKVLDFLAAHDEVLIVEELDRILEPEIKALAWDAGSTTKLRARTQREELLGELGPDRTGRLLATAWPDLFSTLEDPVERGGPVARTPQMCPGCGHRAAFHAVKNALPDAAITVADIGCHTMGYYPPHEVGQLLLCMGHANGTAAGLTLGNDQRKVVSFIGDSTFFHAGLPAIINAVLYDHDFTLVVMENGTTAMTGHQPHAASGEISEKIPIQGVLEALGVKFLRNVDAYDQKALGTALRQALDHRGFAVVIARHPCMLKFVRQQRKKGAFSPLQMKVVETCNRSYVCVEQFACPSFVRNPDGSVTVHEDLCIGDGSCMAVCPVGALQLPKKGE